jgi:hypothetical protein
VVCGGGQLPGMDLRALGVSTEHLRLASVDDDDGSISISTCCMMSFTRTRTTSMPTSETAAS